MLYAIEVKNSSKIVPKDFNSLLSFREDYPEAKLVFLYRGNERILKYKHILCLPIEKFLLHLLPGMPLCD